MVILKIIRKILLLGSSGLAGKSFYNELKKRGFKVYGVARKNADIEQDLKDFDKLQTILKKSKPDLIINCAAKVDLNFCEKFPGESWLINSALVSILTNWSISMQIPFLQISTDHFFCGNGPIKNKEEADVFLINNYSRQKYSAEFFALISKFTLVIRTSFSGIRGWEEKTFAEWALDIVNNDTPGNLYVDAWTSTIDVTSLVNIALELLLEHQYFGLINIGASEVYSKAAFVEELAKQKRVILKNTNKVSIFSQDKLRPNSLGLDVSKVERILGYQMPDLKNVISKIISQETDNEILHDTSNK